jgi:small subunit ribosomal protein S1
VEDATKHLTVGQEVEAKIISIDRKSRVISLSIKAKDEVEEREAVERRWLHEKAPLCGAFSLANPKGPE